MQESFKSLPTLFYNHLPGDPNASTSALSLVNKSLFQLSSIFIQCLRLAASSAIREPKKTLAGILLSQAYSTASYDPQKLVAHYRFSTGTAEDIAPYGGGYEGTFHNGAAITATDQYGNRNSALHCDGVDDYLDIGGDPRQTDGSEQSIFVIVRFSSHGPYSVIFWNDDSQTGGDRGLEGTEDGALYAIREGDGYGGLTSNRTLELGVYYCITFTMGAEGGRNLYINGVLEAHLDGVAPYNHDARTHMSLCSGWFRNGPYRGFLDGDIAELYVHQEELEPETFTDQCGSLITSPPTPTPTQPTPIPTMSKTSDSTNLSSTEILIVGILSGIALTALATSLYRYCNSRSKKPSGAVAVNCRDLDSESAVEMSEISVANPLTIGHGQHTVAHAFFLEDKEQAEASVSCSQHSGDLSDTKQVRTLNQFTPSSPNPKTGKNKNSESVSSGQPVMTI